MMNLPPPRGPVVLRSGFACLIERFRLSLCKLILFVKGFYAVAAPVVLWSCGPVVLWSCGPVVLWSGFGGLINRFRLSL